MKAAIRRFMPAILVVLLAVSLFSLVGCFGAQQNSGSNDDGKESTQREQKGSDTNSKKDSKKDDDDVIIAGTVDTSSNYSFAVDGAFVGMDEYSDVPEVILVCEFTNNSDSPISFGSALDAIAFQGGYELSDAYLRGASSYNYENIAPGKTVPVFIGWKLISAKDSVEISVIDRYHYAKEEIFSQKYTIDELIENTKEYSKEYSGIVDENQEVIV